MATFAAVQKKSLQLLVGAALLAAALVANVVLTHNLLTAPFPGHNDFLSRWEGARSFFIDGVSPYSEEASLNIQMRIFGRPVESGEDPGYFAYPFYTLFFVWPTVYLHYAWAAAIWMVLLEVCLITALFFLLNLYGWRPRPWLLALLVLWALFDYFPARGLILGQPGLLVYLFQMVAIWAFWRRHDRMAGVMLALSTFKPQMAYLLVPMMLLAAFFYRRRSVYVAFGITFALLMTASFLLQPDWLGAWIEQVRLYPQYTAVAYPDTGSPVWIIFRYYLGGGPWLEAVVTLLLGLPVLWAWYSVLLRRQEQYLLWAAALTLVFSHLVALRTATPHFVVFNLALIFYLQRLDQTRGPAFVAVLIAALFAGNWFLFTATVQGRGSLEHPVLFLPLPFVLYGLLLLTGRSWGQHAPQLQPSAAHPGR
jgi:hypothetical protein